VTTLHILNHRTFSSYCSLQSKFALLLLRFKDC